MVIIYFTNGDKVRFGKAKVQDVATAFVNAQDDGSLIKISDQTRVQYINPKYVLRISDR